MNMYLIISNDDNNVMSIYTNYIYYYMLGPKYTEKTVLFLTVFYVTKTVF